MDNQEIEKYMKLAVKQAQKAQNLNEVPVGAVIVYNGKVIAKAYNKREKTKCATHHAEILAIEKACKKLNNFRLVGTSIFVTLEPCVMCMGAILNARIDNLYFGAYANKENTISCAEINSRAGLNHSTNITGGILGEQIEQMVKLYFKSKR